MWKVFGCNPIDFTKTLQVMAMALQNANPICVRTSGVCIWIYVCICYCAEKICQRFDSSLKLGCLRQAEDIILIWHMPGKFEKY